MLQQQINRSPDLKRLRDEGFEIEVKGGQLVVHHIPYVNSSREVKFGKLISPLSLNNDVTIKPDNHVINFMGEYPCNNDGTPITAIQHQTLNQPLFDGVVMKILAKDFRVIKVPERKICKECDLKTFCTAEGLITGLDQ